MLAPGPATWSALAFLQLFPCPANPSFSSLLLFGVLDPTDELVARQGRDVLPDIECCAAGLQRIAQVCRELVHNPTGKSLAAHRAKVAGRRTEPGSSLRVAPVER